MKYPAVPVCVVPFVSSRERNTPTGQNCMSRQLCSCFAAPANFMVITPVILLLSVRWTALIYFANFSTIAGMTLWLSLSFVFLFFVFFLLPDLIPFHFNDPFGTCLTLTHDDFCCVFYFFFLSTFIWAWPMPWERGHLQIVKHES